MKAISSVYGKIRRLLLIIPSDGKRTFDEGNIRERFGKLFQALSDRVAFVVLGDFTFGESEREGKRVQGLIPSRLSLSDQKQIQLDVVDLSLFPEIIRGADDNFPNHWAQDPFCTLSEPGGSTLLLEPFQFAHRANQVIAEHLSDGLGLNLRSTRYFLEGGNILVGDDYMLVGRNLLLKNAEKYCPNESLENAQLWLEAEFRRLFGMDHIFWIGNENPVQYPGNLLNAGAEKSQPLFHLDLFVTLGGPSTETPGAELVFVGQVMDADLKDAKNESQKTAFGMLKTALDEVANQITTYTDSLHGPEFEVVRLPMKIGFGQTDMVIYSYNNCLVEVYRNVKKVYLPEYSLESAHDPEGSICGCVTCQAERKFSARGFRVIFVSGSFQQYAKAQGSLHCLTKVLQRENKSY
ncbi:MAG: agmatine deiminase family protein [Bacteroidia bacterium]|nr:agmatine deiminase family protein [Bacteroidia bacterium]